MFFKLTKYFTIFGGINQNRQNKLDTPGFVGFNYIINGFKRTTSDMTEFWKNFTQPFASFYQDSDDENPEFYQPFKDWWSQNTQGHSGLAIYVVPIIVTQLSVVKRATPFLINICTQYLDPLNLVVLYGIQQRQLIRVFKSLALIYLGLNGLSMVSDLCFGGATFLSFHPTKESFALITGATSATGEDLAKLYYQQGFNLILISMHESKLKKLKSTIIKSKSENSQEYKVDKTNKAVSSQVFDSQFLHSLSVAKLTSNPGAEIISSLISPFTQRNRDIILFPYDLRSVNNVIKLGKQLEKRKLKVDVFVNNGNEYDHNSFMNMPWTKMRSMIDTNIQSSVMLTRLLLPPMIQRFKSEGRVGRILFVSSMEACSPSPNAATYAASKAFISSFAKSLRKECLTKGVAVTCAFPGPICHNPSSQPKKWIPNLGLTMSSSRAAHLIFQASKRGRNYIVLGWPNKIYSHFITKLLPESILSQAASLFYSPSGIWNRLLLNSDIGPLFQENGDVTVEGRSSKSRYDINNKYNENPEKSATRDHTSKQSILNFQFQFKFPDFSDFRNATGKWFLERWEEPLIDYKSVRSWFTGLKDRGRRPGRTESVPSADIASDAARADVEYRPSETFEDHQDEEDGGTLGDVIDAENDNDAYERETRASSGWPASPASQGNSTEDHATQWDETGRDPTLAGNLSKDVSVSESIDVSRNGSEIEKHFGNDGPYETIVENPESEDEVRHDHQSMDKDPPLIYPSIKDDFGCNNENSSTYDENGEYDEEFYQYDE